MPVGRHKGSNIHEYTDLTALHALVRIIEVEGSPVEINIYQDRSVRQLPHRDFLLTLVMRISQKVTKTITNTN